MKRSRALSIAVFAFFFALAIAAAFIRVRISHALETQRRSAGEVLTARAYSLEKEIDRLAAAAHELSAFGRIGPVPEAEVAEIRKRFPVVSGLAFRDAAQATNDDEKQAVQERQLIFAQPAASEGEPLTLRGYLPVFRANSLAGFIVVSADVDAMLRQADVARLPDRGFDYFISRNVQGRSMQIARSTEVAIDRPVEVPIAIPGGDWTLAAAPRLGWRSTRPSMREAASGCIASLLVALFVFDLLRRPERLEREAEVRARRLVETSRKLMDEMTERERAEEQAKWEASHDQLTGLPNRSHFLARMSRLMERNRADPAFCWSLLLINIDRFKNINDSLGTPAGDRILIETARRLELALRPDDMVARVGADEFAVACAGSVDALDVTHIAQRLHSDIAQGVDIGGEEAFATASIGVALSSTAYANPEEPLRDAHLAMNAAKRDGGARHVLFDRAMHERALQLSRIERDLRTAIERNELRAFYQPIVSLETGTVSGFEALVRWQHPERGFVNPGAFLPVAEATGQIVPIDRWVLVEAARYVRALTERDRPYTISVNLSGKQFADPSLCDVVHESLQKSGIDPHQVRLEITESVMMQNADFAFKTLEQLKKLDVQISLDDFGTGYSSLSYIQQFPIDILKIDRSFVSKMTESAKDEEIVRIILVLAQTLELKVVAEGIETPQHLAQLRALHCTYGQGYLFSKPIDAASMDALLAKQPRW